MPTVTCDMCGDCVRLDFFQDHDYQVCKCINCNNLDQVMI